MQVLTAKQLFSRLLGGGVMLGVLSALALSPGAAFADVRTATFTPTPNTRAKDVNTVISLDVHNTGDADITVVRIYYPSNLGYAYAFDYPDNDSGPGWSEWNVDVVPGDSTTFWVAGHTANADVTANWNVQVTFDTTPITATSSAPQLQVGSGSPAGLAGAASSINPGPSLLENAAPVVPLVGFGLLVALGLVFLRWGVSSVQNAAQQGKVHHYHYDKDGNGHSGRY